MSETKNGQATPTIIDHFSASAKSYDEKNLPLASIADNMHFLIRLILKNAPPKSKVLCVGVGTGAEILSLAKAYPQYSFVGVDPAAGMLEVCRARLKDAGVLDRCELIHGYVQDVPKGSSFDVAMSVLVGHFVKVDERLAFYQALTERLKAGGYFVNTEISYDLDSKEFPLMQENWKEVQTLMGATPESLANLSKVLREMLSVISPEEVTKIISKSGISTPVRFFQAFLISGWYGIKP